MSDLERRPSRATREQRAFRLTVGTGVSGTVAIVSFVLGVVGIIGYGLFLLSTVVAVICGLLLRRALGR